MLQRRTFAESSAEAKALLLWWNDLPNRRGERAALARANSPLEVVMSSAYQQAWRRHFVGLKLDQEAMPAVLGLLARVRTLDSRGLGKALAQGKTGGDRGLSELRFRRLLQMDEIEPFYATLRRAVDLIGRSAPVADLAEVVYLWARTHSLSSRGAALTEKQSMLLAGLVEQRNRTRKQLAYDYYEFSPTKA